MAEVAAVRPRSVEGVGCTGIDVQGGCPKLWTPRRVQQLASDGGRPVILFADKDKDGTCDRGASQRAPGIERDNRGEARRAVPLHGRSRGCDEGGGAAMREADTRYLPGEHVLALPQIGGCGEGILGP